MFDGMEFCYASPVRTVDNSRLRWLSQKFRYTHSFARSTARQILQQLLSPSTISWGSGGQIFVLLLTPVKTQCSTLAPLLQRSRSNDVAVNYDIFSIFCRLNKYATTNKNSISKLYLCLA